MIGRRQRQVDVHYEVKVNGAWVSVPPGKILKQSAPDIGFHVCAPFKFDGQAMRRFSVGEVVTWIPDLLLRSETHGDYRIVAAMPDRDGDHMYRIKSPLEEYERVVKEDLLVKSNGYLPEQTPTRVSRHSSITLPSLQPA